MSKVEFLIDFFNELFLFHLFVFRSIFVFLSFFMDFFKSHSSLSCRDQHRFYESI